MQQCLSNQGANIDPKSIRQIRSTHLRYGPYIDGDWTQPLFHQVKFSSKNQLEYFRPSHNDNSSDTLYRFDSNDSLSIPLFSNFSFSPGIELFAYENKIGHAHLLRISPALKVTYTFDWYSGGRWKKALIYAPDRASSQ